MKILTTLLLLAASSGAFPAAAQMTLPQQRMFESMRGLGALNQGLAAAKEAAKNDQNEPAHHVSYTHIALVVGAFWLYTRCRRSAQAAKSRN